ncbi:MAG: hypothetical protein QG656_2164 [Candidatus Hydrogenedentes bacterium]|nr:hypothetical protein [Candidatus Hydrogenedentota bacterium]
MFNYSDNELDEKVRLRYDPDCVSVLRAFPGPVRVFGKMAEVTPTMHTFTFMKEFMFSPRNISSVVPSSRMLADSMTDAAGVASSPVVVEFGPGTGVITESIIRKLPEGGTFMAFEINPAFVAVLRKRYPNVQIVHDSAANARAHLTEAGIEYCDCIVSGLPWASFDEGLQEVLLNAVQDILRPGGRFVTFTYLQSPLLPSGKRFKDKLSGRFQQVGKTPTVWLNVPPAFSYYATK